MTNYKILSFLLNQPDFPSIFIELTTGDTLEPIFIDWTNSTKNIVSGIFFEILDPSPAAPEGQTQIVFCPWANIAKISQVRPIDPNNFGG